LSLVIYVASKVLVLFTYVCYSVCAIVMKYSGWIGSGVGCMLLNLPGGSTMQ